MARDAVLAKQPGKKAPFRFVRWFLIISFLTISLTATATGLILSGVFEREILAREGAVTKELINSAARAERLRFFFTSYRSPDSQRFLQRLFSEIASLPDVLRANIYSIDHRILWSSNRKMIGVKFTKNNELDAAAAGRVVVVRERSSDLRKAEHAFLKGVGSSFLEVYVPISEPKTGRILAVAEVYKSPAALDRAIANGITWVWVCALVGGGLLYLTLAAVITGTHKLLVSQHREIVAGESMKLTGEMASAVAHGLRNPLASIRTSAELARMSEGSEGLHGELDDIIAQTDRMDSWLRELLIGALDDNLQTEKLEVVELVKEAISAHKVQIDRKGMSTNVNVSDNVRPILGNRIALRQVFTSIVSNAVEAVNDGGRLDVNIESDGADVRIKVTDSGGIGRDKGDWDVTPMVTSKKGGLGIGLPLASRVVERHGGDLKIRGTTMGTVVEIALPGGK